MDQETKKTETKPSRVQDPELRTMAAIWRLLSKLPDDGARVRAAEWAVSKARSAAPLDEEEEEEDLFSE